MIVDASINLMPDQSVARAVELAVAAENLGFARCLVYDEGLASRDVYVTLAAIAVATSKIAMGPGITNPYTRHAASTAAAIASLDELSGGRALLGIGAGGSLTLDPLGIARHRPLTAVRETIAACRQLFAGHTATTDGTHVSLHQASLKYGRPDIPIWLAGRGPKMLTLGGADCDGVMLDFIYKPHLPHAVSLIRRGADTTGNHPRISYSTVFVTDEQALVDVKPHLTYRLVDSPQEVKEEIGLGADDELAIRSAMADGLEAAAKFVKDEWVFPFVIHGSERECRAEITQLVDQFEIGEFLLPILDDDRAESLISTVAQVLQL